MQETVLGCNTCVSVSESKAPTRKIVRTRLQFGLVCTKSTWWLSHPTCVCVRTLDSVAALSQQGPDFCACSSYSTTTDPGCLLERAQKRASHLHTLHIVRTPFCHLRHCCAMSAYTMLLMYSCACLGVCMCMCMDVDMCIAWEKLTVLHLYWPKGCLRNGQEYLAKLQQLIPDPQTGTVLLWDS